MRSLPVLLVLSLLVGVMMNEELVTDGSFKVWDPTGMTQEDFMHKDECIMVDGNDVIADHKSKYKAHRFEGKADKECFKEVDTLLHRAFSVFLFDETGRMLLQQRAADKITFPSVWTNTCCSHPLFGYKPTEVDSDEDIASGAVPGAKHAAVRKLKHEYGIPPEAVPLSKFKFLTRLHYCAGDEGTYGAKAPWGEHEMDYILVIQVPRPKLTLDKAEIGDVRWVTHAELKEMMSPASGLKWSPWFRIIEREFLGKWWANLTHTLTTDTFVDTKTIHKLEV